MRRSPLNPPLAGSADQTRRADSTGRPLRLLAVGALAFALRAVFGVAPAWADTAQADTDTQPSVAFYYGATPPIDVLASYDIAVLEPDSGFLPREHPEPATRWFAYASVGEIGPQRRYYGDIPADWFIGRNSDWNSHIVDQSKPGWPAFFVRHVIDPLWDIGYRGFFLDTLDSYQLAVKTDAARALQRDGLVRVIHAIKKRHPHAQLILNRGFELLPQVHADVDAIAFESLFNGWDQAKQRYVPVPEADRAWLLSQARIVRAQYKLPVIAIDYCAPGDDACARSSIEQTHALGLIPFVTDGALQTVRPAPVLSPGHSEEGMR
ncbi:endo alpha-1,4 polygalactosaminidase [Trinickia sp.]|uniref:endo alpha-1,4 polygalactosaminidase n=1 Tax=Trinickia sp. TaxID=2571163 RepID=UPI003F7E8158